MWHEKKMKLSNPNFHVSKTRLSIRGIPKNLTEKQLRELFKNAAMQDGAKFPPKIKQVKIVTDRNALDEKGEPRSRGFGFVEFINHVDALNALRNTNNVEGIFKYAPERLLTVEFALENLQIMKKREKKIMQQNQRLKNNNNLQNNENNGRKNNFQDKLNKRNKGQKRKRNETFVPRKRKKLIKKY